jgi:transposase
MSHPDDLQSDDAVALRQIRVGCPEPDAVTAGMSVPRSAWQAEGQNTRVKLIKRQGYGRANFDLLRKRILMPT